MADIVVKDIQNFVMTVRSDIGKEDYKLSNATNWPLESFLIQEARSQVVQTLNLAEVFKNLNNGVLLLDITYNAVYGMKGLSSEVAGLQSRLLTTMDRSLTTTQGFKTATRATASEFVTAYGFLTKQNYATIEDKEKNGLAMAYRIFEKIIARARTMGNDAKSLAKDFESLRDNTVGINQGIIKKRDISYEEKKSLNERLSGMQAQVEALKQIKEDLSEEIDAYTQEHSNLSRRAQRQDDRAFSLALTSAIMGGVSGIIGAIIPVGSNAKSDTPDNGGSGGDTASGGGSAPGGETTSKQAESEKRVKELQEEIDRIGKEIAGVNAKLDSEEADKESLLEEKDRLTREKIDKQKELEGAKEQSKVFQQAAQGISGGLNITSQKLDQLAENQGNSADRLYERIDKIAAQKAKLTAERRETIMQLATLTKSIEHGTVEEADLQVAIDALITAVGCMRLVEVYLSDIALFWANVEKFCQRLLESIKDINDYTENFIGFQNYTGFFQDEDFMRMYLINVASWVALYYVSDEYVQAFNEAREAHKNAIGQMGGDRKQHWELARQRAGEMAGIFNNQLADMG